MRTECCHLDFILNIPLLLMYPTSRKSDSDSSEKTALMLLSMEEVGWPEELGEDPCIV